ncbi:talin-2 isoform X2 [Condylostylus longicornis]|uniref:talin-2 isoform X2 n=1 Tax=Condylostylus longicornis TaxID=2530218 RepID=UPI00244DC947|nr:talin-2 isoform X2 [Condylostylus longicornis]
MATLSLRISLEGGRVTKTIQFNSQTTVFDACKIIRDKFAEAVSGAPNEYGLFLSDEENRQGVWLESGRSLGYYMLHNQDTLEYRRKLRTLRVRMLDGAVKTILVDDSQPVNQLMVVICTKIGITNHEEYGLVREEVEQQNENLPDNKFGTLTLRKKIAEKDRDAKMESLRKKLKTDDEINWVDIGKTLREQGIDESETVLLRRKFFFSDQNIDSRDPVQLNLLYVQARDAILDGTHPVTQDKACEFAGIQVHIQFGPHNEAKHKPGFLDLKDFLPQSYVRVKNIEKKIFGEHRKHVELSEIDAKVLYTKTARELPTYGVTFFLVKEKMTGKNKLVPRLLGVTKDSVLRLDEKTKEILKTWPLTTVRRWGASPNTFTLDFGDYADAYYSVQTTEAEHIVQLIAGYIDIILKKKKAKDHFGIEGDEGSTMVEESVAPSRATFFQHETSKIGKINTESVAHPGIMRAYDGEKPFTQNEMQSVQYGAIVGTVNVAHQPPTTQEIRISEVHLSEPQRALLGYISAGQEAIQRAERELESKIEFLELGSDPHSIEWRETTLETSKQAVTTHVATMNAATAQIVTAVTPDEVDTEAIGSAVTQITQTIPEVTKEVKLIASLMDDDNSGEKLLDATRRLCNAFSDLLRAAEPEGKDQRQNLINAASRVGEATTMVLSTIGEETPESRDMYDMLLALAKAVANATAALVLRAKSIAANSTDEESRDRVIGAAGQCALATSQLVACTKVVAPTIQNPACKEQLEEAAREVANTVHRLVDVCNEATVDERLKGDLVAAARDVSEKLKDLLSHIKKPNATETSNVFSEEVESVIVGTEILASSTDPQEMVRHAKSLGQATAHLIQSIKGEAESQDDSDLQRRLLAAAKQLADATAKMVEAARLCGSSPHETKHQEALRRAAEELREVTTTAVNTPALKIKLINRLENCAKQAASAATQCISAAQNAAQHSEDHQTKETLLQDCRNAADSIPRLVTGVKSTLMRPEDGNAHLNLIEAAEMFIEPASQMASSARALQPTVQDIPAAQQLSKSALHLSHTIHELNLSAQRAREVCGGQELESALEAIKNLRTVLNDTREAAIEGTLRPLPGETVENTAQQLSKSAKNVGIALSQLISAVSQGQRMYAGVAGRDTALALGDFTRSVHGVAATTKNPVIIDAADEVIVNSVHLLEEAQRNLQNIGNIENLSRSARDVSAALNKTVDCIPGQREVDDALRNVSELSEILSMGEYPESNKSYNHLQNELKLAAENLNTSGREIVQGYASPQWLATSSQAFSIAYKDMLSVSMEMAGQAKDETSRTTMLECLRNVSTQSCSLLSTAKSIAADPGQPNSKNLLNAASRSVTDSINKLVDCSVSSAPGQKECDNAIRSIESLRVMLDYPHEPVNELGYFDCVENANEKSRNLGYAISEMINNAKQSQHVEFGHSVNSVSDSIHGLIESAAQAAYLIGVSHPSSVSGRPGIIDQAQLTRAYQGTRQHCDIVSSPQSTKQQKIAALTVIAKHTSYLCTICRQASMNTTNPVAKNEFIVGAKHVANATSDLVQEVKSLEDDYSVPSRSKFVEPLLDAVKAVRQYASSPEFISIPAKISAEGRKAQEPVLSAGRGVLDGVVEMVKAAKSLAVSPNDPPVWQQLAMHSKPVSESVKRLVDNIKDKAPGQAQCDQVLQTLATCTRELDTTALAASSQGLAQRKDNNLQGFIGQTLNAAAELLDKLEPIRIAGKHNAEQLGHAVGEISRYVVPMTNGAIGACTHIVHTNQQITLINQTKSVVESAIELVQSAKESAGNPKAVKAHPMLDDSIQNTREAIQELNQTAEKLSTESGVVTGLMEQISRIVSRLTDKRQSLLSANATDSFVDYQTRMVQTAKEIARVANEMNAKAPYNPQQLPQLAVDMTQHYTRITEDSVGAAMTTTSPDVGMRIRQCVIDLGRSVMNIIQSTAGVRPDDATSQADVARNARDVSEKVAQVLVALQAGSKGTQACINAANTVAGIIGDLDTTIMFASAGTLHSDDKGTFADHRENILKTAKALVEDTKVLVAGAAGTQDQLASAAQNAVTTILQLSDAVKRGACSLGSEQPDSQVMVINAVKDVASALRELIHATKTASGKPINDPAMQDLKESARVMVLNVSSLLKTVKAVEDEHTRGTRAMEATVEAISQEIRTMNSPPPSNLTPATPEDLIRVSKNVTTATAKAVAAGTSNLQADIVAAANIGRRAISEMLLVCRQVAWTCAETEELRQRTLEAGAAVGESYHYLLVGILKNCSADDRMHYSRRVAKCVTDLCAMAKLLKGSDWIDPEDPTVIAENELLGAAASIDAAAKKLASLRPRRQPDVKMPDENMNFDEMILEAAKSIMAASAALVRAANAAQRELIDQGKVARRPLHSSDDGQWSEGLISAARLVAAATHSLVEAAQNLVRGVGTEEKLISTAKQVAASTAQLLIACKVKSNPNSETGRRLQSAGNSVIKATDNLVNAAQQALDAEDEHVLKINTSMVDRMRQEIDARSEVYKMEKKLAEARDKLVQIRHATARQNNPSGFGTFNESTDSTDEYHQYHGSGGYSSPTHYQTNSLNRSGFNVSPSLGYQQQQQQQQQQHQYYQTLPTNYQQQQHNYPYHHETSSNQIYQSSFQKTSTPPPPIPPPPQHFHHPDLINDNLPPPPPPPPLSTAYNQREQISSLNTTTFRPNPTLTANAIPRPYPGSPNVVLTPTSPFGVGINNQTLLTTTTTNYGNITPTGNNTTVNTTVTTTSANGGVSPLSPLSKITNQNNFETSHTSSSTINKIQKSSTDEQQSKLNDQQKHQQYETFEQKMLKQQQQQQQKSDSSTSTKTTKISKNIEATVKDLHDKTFGQGGVIQITGGFKPSGTGPQNYEGYTSRYETRSYESSSEIKPLESNFSQLTIRTDNNGRLNLEEEGSQRLSSMTQRVLERKILTTTTESRTETKSQKHSFRLEKPT